MWIIRYDNYGRPYDYAGEGQWLPSGEGISFATKKEADDKLKADMDMLSPRLRLSVAVMQA